MRSGVTFSSPLRNLSKRLSVRWHSVTSSPALRKPAPPLDRVETAENLVEQADIVRRPLQIDQLVVHAGQQILGLDEKILQQLFHSGEITHGSPMLFIDPDPAPIKAGRPL